MIKKQEDFGIFFNKEIPKIDKINKTNINVKIEFSGKAYLIIKKQNKTEKREIKNGIVIKQDGKYAIEFINLDGKLYNLELKINKTFPFLILFSLFILCLSFIFLGISKNKKANLVSVSDFINLDVIPFENIINNYDVSKIDKVFDNSIEINRDLNSNVNNNEYKSNLIDNKYEIEKNKYFFDVSFEHEILSDEISLMNTISAKSLANGKIAPGTSGKFFIIVNCKKSEVKMKYKINFENLNDQKPKNLKFKINGKNEEYKDLQSLENKIQGVLEPETYKKIEIQWYWPYESNFDNIDTNDGINFDSYIFKIHVTGEEVL